GGAGGDGGKKDQKRESVSLQHIADAGIIRAMRIAVVGVGGVGGYFGGRLAQAGEEVVFVARGATLEALQTDGLRVDSIKGDFALEKVTSVDAAALGRID